MANVVGASASASKRKGAKPSTLHFTSQKNIGTGWFGGKKEVGDSDEEAKSNELIGGEIPAEDERKIDAVIQKMCAGEVWKERRVVVTSEYIMFAKKGTERILDVVPLHQIEKLEVGQEVYLSMTTLPNGYNSGRPYVLMVSSESEGQFYQKTIGALVKAAVKKHKRKERFVVVLQQSVRDAYTHWISQSFVALLIFSNFVINAAEAQLNPLDDTTEGRFFRTMEPIFTAVFALELAVNMFAHWWKRFWYDGWNIFDFIVVSVSLLALALNSVPGISVLRLMRAFRVLRLFGRLGAQRKIVNALAASLLPVVNALLIVMLVMCIYSILGVQFFSEKSQKFATFLDALFTMFQIATFDNWSDVSRELFNDEGHVEFWTAFFFCTYIIIGSWMLLPVVVALLLDNFSNMAANEEAKAAEDLKYSKRAVAHVLDPLLSSLSLYDSSADLSTRIQAVYELLDSDDSGGLSFQEMNVGFKKLNLKPGIHLSREDYDNLTRNGALLNAKGEVGPQEFEALIRTQIRNFLQRNNASALMVAAEHGDLTSAIFASIKHIVMDLDEVKRDLRVLHQERELGRGMHALLGTFRRGNDGSESDNNNTSGAVGLTNKEKHSTQHKLVLQDLDWGSRARRNSTHSLSSEHNGNSSYLSEGRGSPGVAVVATGTRLLNRQLSIEVDKGRKRREQDTRYHLSDETRNQLHHLRSIEREASTDEDRDLTGRAPVRPHIVRMPSEGTSLYGTHVSSLESVHGAQNSSRSLRCVDDHPWRTPSFGVSLYGTHLDVASEETGQSSHSPSRHDEPVEQHGGLTERWGDESADHKSGFRRVNSIHKRNNREKGNDKAKGHEFPPPDRRQLPDLLTNIGEDTPQSAHSTLARTVSPSDRSRHERLWDVADADYSSEGGQHEGLSRHKAVMSLKRGGNDSIKSLKRTDSDKSLKRSDSNKSGQSFKMGESGKRLRRTDSNKSNRSGLSKRSNATTASTREHPSTNNNSDPAQFEPDSSLHMCAHETYSPSPEAERGEHTNTPTKVTGSDFPAQQQQQHQQQQHIQPPPFPSKTNEALGAASPHPLHDSASTSLSKQALLSFVPPSTSYLPFPQQGSDAVDADWRSSPAAWHMRHALESSDDFDVREALEGISLMSRGQTKDAAPLPNEPLSINDRRSSVVSDTLLQQHQHHVPKALPSHDGSTHHLSEALLNRDGSSHHQKATLSLSAPSIPPPLLPSPFIPASRDPQIMSRDSMPVSRDLSPPRAVHHAPAWLGSRLPRTLDEALALLASKAAHSSVRARQQHAEAPDNSTLINSNGHAYSHRQPVQSPAMDSVGTIGVVQGWKALQAGANKQPVSSADQFSVV